MTLTDHDEFCGSSSGYTYSTWDGVSGVLDPVTRAVKFKIGNLCLLTQHHEMELAGIVRDAGGAMTFNGAPRQTNKKDSLWAWHWLSTSK